MELFNAYVEWGFTENPFSTNPLQANSVGATLLVGRENELKHFYIQLENGPKLPTIEGLNGVGKTSLVNVGTYKLLRMYLEGKLTKLWIPCDQSFQLSVQKGYSAIVDEIYLSVAQTLLRRAKEIRGMGLEMAEKNQLNTWLNSPLISSLEIGIGGILSGGNSNTANDSSGFEQSGLREIIKKWLLEIFSEGKLGGVVCVIDNMELLETSQHAKQAIEALRDELFNVPGLRFILCGANGIIYGPLASPRLEGKLHKPIEIGGISDDAMSDIYASRLTAYTTNGKPYLPLAVKDFERLYLILNKNMRATLGRADEYCTWVYMNGRKPKGDEEKQCLFESWIVDESNSVYEAISQQMTPRLRDIFIKAINIGGSFSPGQYEQFDCNSIQALRPLVKSLEDLQLLVSQRDEDDQRRKTIHVTSKGYFVKYAIDKQARS